MHDVSAHTEAATGGDTTAWSVPGGVDFDLNDASGLYKSNQDEASPRQRQEELRIDVDGRFPQLVASGTIRQGIDGRLHWLADLAAAGSNRWTGGIVCKHGTSSLLPHTDIEVTVHRTPFGIGQTACVTFSGGGIAGLTRVYGYASRYFHPIEFEVDTAQAGGRATFDIPSIEKVFRHAGFNVGKSGGDGRLPIAAGADGPWSDMELHDAMQAYWSRFASRSPRSMWMLLALRHEAGAEVESLVFEDIGPDRRLGAALFGESIAAEPPAGDTDPAARLAESRLRIACGEMARAFAPGMEPWPRASLTWVPEPGRVDSLEIRFSDRQLRVMRHALDPSGLVGNADWFDDHGLRQAMTADGPLRLEVRANRARPVFEFLEPVVLELKFTNVSNQPMPVDEECLATDGNMTVIIKKDGHPARQWVPYARAGRAPSPRVLAPGQSIGRSLFAAAGRNGWDLAEPGMYNVQAALHRDDCDIVSCPLRLRIAAPLSFEEEILAQDFFSDAVGRILAFDGSRHLESGNDILSELVHRFPDRHAAVHARVALANPMSRDCKQLVLGDGAQRMTSAADAGGRIETVPAEPAAARKGLAAALLKDPEQAAATLGHIDFEYYVGRFAQWLREQDDGRAAAVCQACLNRTLERRQAAGPSGAEIALRSD